MSKIAVVLIEDRHFDADVELFTDPDKAINRAREFAAGQARGWPIEEATLQDRGIGEDKEAEREVQLTESMMEHGWIYNGRYSPDGGDVRVMIREVKP